MVSEFLHEVIHAASQVETSVDGVLRFALRRALQVTESDLGGSLALFDVSGRTPRPMASLYQGRLEDRTLDVEEHWRQVLPLGSVLPPSQDEPRHLPLCAGARSALWSYLLDGRRVVGVFQVESSCPEAYGTRDRATLAALAEGALPGIYRGVLAHRMRKMGFGGTVVGASPAFLALDRAVQRAASSPRGGVLVRGERGSGKELVARSLHCWSQRAQGPFVPILTSTFGDELLSSELFGHEKHAFTGAAQHRKGRLQAADGGTVFLDEVADFSLNVQSSVLRVLEQGELPRLGRDLPVEVDLRVVAATNKDLGALMEARAFRRDLYDRLRVFEIFVPPLRERRSDVRALTNYFLQRYCDEMRRCLAFERTGICARCFAGQQISCVTSEFYAALESYDWPGNVRELEHLVIRLLATVRDEVLDVRHLPREIRAPGIGRCPATPGGLELEDVIRQHIERVLVMTGFNQTRAAAVLGVPLSTMRSKMKKLGISLQNDPRT